MAGRGKINIFMLLASIAGLVAMLLLVVAGLYFLWWLIMLGR